MEFIIGWIILIIIFIVIEGVTLSLSSIWFGIGAFVALILALLNLNFIIQLLGFSITSAILLLTTMPIVKKRIKIKITPTNLDMVVGEIGLVKERIEPFKTGVVYIQGKEWTAKSDETIDVNEYVKIIKIEGVKLIVTKGEKTND